MADCGCEECQELGAESATSMVPRMSGGGVERHNLLFALHFTIRYAIISSENILRQCSMDDSNY